MVNYLINRLINSLYYHKYKLLVLSCLSYIYISQKYLGTELETHFEFCWEKRLHIVLINLSLGLCIVKML